MDTELIVTGAEPGLEGGYRADHEEQVLPDLEATRT